MQSKWSTSASNLKKRWMPNLRPQIGDQLFRAELTKQFTNSSQKGLLMCTSSLQVHCRNLQVKFTSAFKCSYKCSVCLTINLTVILFRS
jgi:hypothetical protein